MRLSLQLSTSTLSSILWEHLKRGLPAICDPSPLGFYIDHLEVVQPSISRGGSYRVDVPVSGGFQPADAARVRLTAGVVVHTASLLSLPTDGSAGPPSTDRHPISVSFDLALERLGSQVSLTASVSDIDFGGALSFLAPFEPSIRAAFPTVKLPFDVLGMFRSYQVPTTVVHAGLALDPGSSTVELRMEIAPPGTGSAELEEWRRFLRDGPFGLRGTDDMALFISHELLTNLANGWFDKWRSTQSKLDVHHHDVTWDATGGRAGFRIHVVGEIDDVECLWADVDVPMDATLSLALSTEGNDLRTDFAAAASFDPPDVCVLAALLAPLGAIIGGVGTAVLGQPLLGAPLVIDGIAGFANGLSSSPSLPPPTAGPERCEVVDGALVCRVPVADELVKSPDCRPAVIESTRLTTVRGTPEGLVLGSQVRVSSVPLSVPLVQPPPAARWTEPTYDCSGHSDGWRATTEIVVTASGLGPLRVCRPWPFDTNLRPHFSAKQLKACPDEVLGTMSVPLWEPVPAQSKVAIFTSGGARVVTISTPPPPNADDARHGDLMARIEAVSECKARSDPWGRIGGRLNPKYLVDPPPYAEVIAHQVSIAAKGLPEQAVVVVESTDPARAALAAATVVGGMVTLDVSTPPVSGLDPGFVLALTSPTGEDGAEVGAFVLVLSESLLRETARIEPSAKVLALHAGTIHGTPTVTAVLDGAAYRWTVDASGRATLLDQVTLPELASATASRSGIMGWAADQVVSIDPRRASLEVSVSRGREVGGGALNRVGSIVVDRGAARLVGTGGTEVDAVEVDEPTAVAVSGRHALVVSAAGVERLAVGGTGLRRTGLVELAGVEELAVSPSDGATVAARNADGWWGLRLATDGSLTSSAEPLPARPWYVGAVGTHDLLARVDERGSTVTLMHRLPGRTLTIDTAALLATDTPVDLPSGPTG